MDEWLQSKNWDNWIEFCSDTQLEPLQDRSSTIQQLLLLSFDAQNRWGYYGRGRQVVSQTPETVCRPMTQTIVLPVYSYPRQSYGFTDINLTFSHLLKSYNTDNPAPKPQLSLPTWAIQCVADLYHTKQTLLATAVADLFNIFFLILCPVENSMTSSL